LALPAITGMTSPAAAARRRADQMSILGTSPSNSAKASAISSSTAASDLICWWRSLFAHVASWPQTLPSAPPPSAHSSAEHMLLSSTLSNREPV